MAAVAAGARFGAKLVRGAYLQTERARARERREADPTQPTIVATHAWYRRVRRRAAVARRCRRRGRHVRDAQRGVRDGVAAGAAALPPHLRARVSLAQLLGMCNHLTESLAAAGLPVASTSPTAPCTR